MATEIERKFLVVSDAWRSLCTRRQQIRDGLVAMTDDRKVRVRILARKATLTIKVRRAGNTNTEFEYEIPMADAEVLLASHCGPHVLTKTRYDVPCAGFLWQVDVYEGILAGVILAEVELPRAGIHVPLPDWVGKEVTGLPEYRKYNMLNVRLKRAPPLGRANEP